LFRLLIELKISNGHAIIQEKGIVPDNRGMPVKPKAAGFYMVLLSRVGNL